MKTKWINFYLRTAITFFIYFFLNEYIQYDFLLEKKVVVIFFLFTILFSIIFYLKKNCVYLFGIISGTIFLLLVLIEIIHLYDISRHNIGESGFGIVEIISLIPLLLINIFFISYNFYRLKKDNTKSSVAR